jgi:hypothetical protein
VIRTDDDAMHSIDPGAPPVGQQRGGERRTTPGDDDDISEAGVEEWRS